MDPFRFFQTFCLLKSTWDKKHFVFQFGLEIAPARAVFTLWFDDAKNEIQFVASHTEWCYNSNGHDEK